MKCLGEDMPYQPSTGQEDNLGTITMFLIQI